MSKRSTWFCFTLVYKPSVCRVFVFSLLRHHNQRHQVSVEVTAEMFLWPFAGEDESKQLVWIQTDCRDCQKTSLGVTFSQRHFVFMRMFSGGFL